MAFIQGTGVYLKLIMNVYITDSHLKLKEVFELLQYFSSI